MNAWLQLALTLAGVGGVVMGAGRWMMRGLGQRMTEIVRAETAPQFAGVRSELADLRHQGEMTNQRLGALEVDMTLIKQRLLGVG